MFSIIPVVSALIITLLVGIAFPKNHISALLSSLLMVPILIYFNFTEVFDVALSFLVIFLCSFVFTDFTDSVRSKITHAFGIKRRNK